MAAARDRTARAACRLVALRLVARLLAGCHGVIRQPALDDLERQEVLLLLAQDPAEPLDVGFVELAVAGRGPLGASRSMIS